MSVSPRVAVVINEFVDEYFAHKSRLSLGDKIISNIIEEDVRNIIKDVLVSCSKHDSLEDVYAKIITALDFIDKRELINDSVIDQYFPYVFDNWRVISSVDDIDNYEDLKDCITQRLPMMEYVFEHYDHYKEECDDFIGDTEKKMTAVGKIIYSVDCHLEEKYRVGLAVISVDFRKLSHKLDISPEDVLDLISIDDLF